MTSSTPSNAPICASLYPMTWRSTITSHCRSGSRAMAAYSPNWLSSMANCCWHSRSRAWVTTAKAAVSVSAVGCWWS